MRSALILPVLDAASTLDRWRERTSGAKPSAGIPPHVTLAFPFVPPPVEDRVIAQLERLLPDGSPFRLELRAFGRFPGVLYLVPEPAAMLVSLYDRVHERFPGFPLYGNPALSFVPHVTVAEGADVVLDAAEAEISPELPLVADVCEAWFIEEAEPDGKRWRTRATLPFRGSGAPS